MVERKDAKALTRELQKNPYIVFSEKVRVVYGWYHKDRGYPSYVGQLTCKSPHRSSYNPKSRTRLNRAFRLLGEDSFTRIVWYVYPFKEHNKVSNKEKEIIAFWRKHGGCQFNIQDGGHSNFFQHGTTRMRSSQSRKGKNHHYYGVTLPEETRRKISESLRGRVGCRLGAKHTDEAKRKISESAKKKWANASSGKRAEYVDKIKEAVTKWKGVACVMEGVEYRSYAEAGRALGLDRKTILGRARSPNFPDCYKIEKSC